MADLISMMSAAAGLGGEEGYQISRSLRFNSADSAYLNRTPASASNRKTWTWSCWYKRSAPPTGSFPVGYGTLFGGGYSGSGATQSDFILSFSEGVFSINNNVNNANVWRLVTTQVFRDVSAWYHIIVALDSTQATDTNRVKLYVNGAQVTAFSTATYPTQNYDSLINTNLVHRIGSGDDGGSPYVLLNGNLAEVHFVDGQQLSPTDFGEFNSNTGVWQPKAYTGSYGTNGFYLDFADNTSTTTLGYDAAGSNDWTLNNFSVTAGVGNDSLVDSPTRYGTDTGVGGEVRGNYATLNPLNSATADTYSQGNLKWVKVANTTNTVAVSTIAVSSGKWYWEGTVANTGGSNIVIGIADSTTNFLSADTNLGMTGSTTSYAYNGTGPYKQNNNTQTSYGATFTTNDVIGVAFDADAGTITFYKNGASQGTAFTGITGTFTPAVGGRFTNDSWWFNFGQRPFAHTAPSGFKALVTTNLPTPTIEDGGEYFNAVLYTGTGSSLGVTGVGFQPDWVWIKERSGAADHGLYDAVRGVQQQLESNTTTDETTESTGLTAFGTDGFTVGALAQLNTSADTYVAWNWKESTTSKFDIVTYTGNGTARTISHNLGVVPNMIIVKARTTASTDQGWPVYHSANTANPETDYLLLDSTAATADLDTVWNDTAPTSSVFSVGTNALVNANNDTYVAYLFANVAGYSAFGSYTGNGSTDGPFVFLNFRPAFVMLKRTDSTSNWTILDFAREGYNVDNDPLYPNLSNAEGTTDLADLLSNGFKLRSTDASVNASGGTYIYAAFCSNPFVYSLAR